jgi:hypothetical protein
MLIFILLGVITKFVVVSADCDIEPPKYKFTDWTNVSYTVPSLKV